MRQLLDYLMEVDQRSMETVAIQAALQPEIDTLWAARTDLLMQLDPNTATWGLAMWESALGLTSDKRDSFPERRAAIVAKIRGIGTTTVTRIKEVVSSFTGTAVDVKEDFGNYSVLIRSTVDIGRVPDLIGIQTALNTIMPAHLVWNIVIALYAQSCIRLYIGFAVRMGRRVTVGCAVPAELDVTYTADENGDILADEAGKRIIE